MSTYTPITSQTLASTASSVTFSNIPQIYTDLVLIVQVTCTAGGNYLYFRLNNDAGSNYSSTLLYGTGSTTGSTRLSNSTFMRLDTNGFMNQTVGNRVMQFQNYSNTTTNKTVLGRDNNSSTGTGAGIGLWRSTSAINTILLYPEGSTFTAGSTFNLYGIVTGSPKANGGNNVRTDGTYWYHTFTSSGMFETVSSLTVDYLVVAGGGGGGEGGGGAGGLRSTVTATGGGGSLESSINLTSNTAFPILIGSGGSGGSIYPTYSTSGSNSVFSTITSIGGGGGGNRDVYYSGLAGGSGGGGRRDGGGSGGSGTANQGYAGGSSLPAGIYKGAGGGGGAGAVGGNGGGGSAGSEFPGSGGNGVSVNISGSSVTYAGGGGGGTEGSSRGSGGSGGGGMGNISSGDNATAGTANTGGGGGGQAGAGATIYGKNGGSGIVIVRYLV